MARRHRFLILLISAAIVLAALNQTAPVSAEGLSASISSSALKPAVGTTITLTIAISSELTVENYDCVLGYNPEYFSYVSNSETNLATGLSTFDIHESPVSVIYVGAFGGSQAKCSKLFKIRFKALKVGFAQFSLSDICVNNFSGGDFPSIAKTITIVAPVVQSSNCSLKSLEIAPGVLSPAFSPGQTGYTAAIAAGVGQIAVSAAAEDSKANVTVSGSTNLKDGANAISVVVTAEDGSKKTYTITANRAAPTPTPAATPTAAATPTPGVVLSLPGGTFTIQLPPPGTQVPDGFYHALTLLNGQMVPVYNALKGELSLFYLSSATGSSGFYYLNSQTQTYLPFQILNLPSRACPVLAPGAGVSAPAGFKAVTLELNGQKYAAWRQETPDLALASRDMYLVYLMDSRGKKDFYWFDKDSQMLAIYLAGQQSAAATPTAVPSATASPSPTQMPQETDVPYNPWQLATFLLGFFCLFLLSLVIWLAMHKVRAAAGQFSAPVRVDKTDAASAGETFEPQRTKLKKPKIRRIE